MNFLTLAHHHEIIHVVKSSWVIQNYLLVINEVSLITKFPIPDVFRDSFISANISESFGEDPITSMISLSSKKTLMLPSVKAETLVWQLVVFLILTLREIFE